MVEMETLKINTYVHTMKVHKLNIISSHNFIVYVYICTIACISLGRDACQGDSGGPLFAVRSFSQTADGISRYELVGITSFGRQCGVIGLPGNSFSISNLN